MNDVKNNEQNEELTENFEQTSFDSQDSSSENTSREDENINKDGDIIYEASNFDKSSLPYVEEDSETDLNSDEHSDYQDKQNDYDETQNQTFVESDEIEGKTEEKTKKNKFNFFDFSKVKKYFKDKNITTNQLLPAILFLATLFFNALATSGVLNSQKTADISKKFNNLFTPANSTFAIWGVIYLLLFIYVAYTFIKLFKAEENQKNRLTSVSTLFIISCVLNILWLFSWHFNMILLSFVFMAGLFSVLYLINHKISKYKNDMALVEKTMLSIPFSLYFGWISIALFANLMALLTSISSGYSNAEFTTSLIMLVAASFCIIYIYQNKNIVFGLAAIWSFSGLFIKHASEVDGFSKEYLGILILLSFIIFFISAITIYSIYKLITERFFKVDEK